MDIIVYALKIERVENVINILFTHYEKTPSTFLESKSVILQFSQTSTKIYDDSSQ